MPLIVKDLYKSFDTPAGSLAVLQGVSLELGPSETLSIVGPSGSGKSTLLNIIGTLERPTSGTVTLDDQEATALREAALAAFRSRRIGFVFQDHHLLPQCTATENVMLPTLATGSPPGAAVRAAELLDRVGLAARASAFPAQLSGGERQRVAIARAMINRPALLLADEPTGNLDRETGDRVGAMFAELASETGVIVIVVTHNTRLASRFLRCMELREGGLRPSSAS